jgi:hypothetical protein
MTCLGPSGSRIQRLDFVCVRGCGIIAVAVVAPRAVTSKCCRLLLSLLFSARSQCQTLLLQLWFYNDTRKHDKICQPLHVMVDDGRLHASPSRGRARDRRAEDASGCPNNARVIVSFFDVEIYVISVRILVAPLPPQRIATCFTNAAVRFVIVTMTKTMPC